MLTVLGACVAGSLCASASAVTVGAGWALTANSYPTNVAPGGHGTIVVNVMNVGAAESNGTVTVTDTLPPGVTATEAGELEGLLQGFSNAPPKINHTDWNCTGNGPGLAPGVAGASVVTCVNDPTNMPHLAGGGGNPMRGGIQNLSEGPNLDPQLAIGVNAPSTEVSGTNDVTIAGGGAPSTASTTDPITVSSKPPAFGFAGWDVWSSNADGTLDTQAGSHPYETTFSYDLNNYFREGGYGYVSAGGENESLIAKLPPGLVGDPTVVAQCTRQQLDAKNCPVGSQIGIIAFTATLNLLGHEPVYNMVAPAGYPDEIGFNILGFVQRLDTGVRTGSDYGLITHVNNIPEETITSSVLTLWGVPGDPSHNIWHGGNLGGGCRPEQVGGPECPSAGSEGKPFLTLPTACAGPQRFSIWGNVWGHPEIMAEKLIETHDSNDNPTGFTGCEHLGFEPTIITAPDTADADTPAGLTVEVNPSVAGLSDVEGLSTSDIQNTTVTLPEGLVINPGQAAGLQACQPSDDALGPLPNGEENNGPPSCPLKSKVGTVSITTPLLPHKLEGNVYILPANPPNLQLLVAASGEGVNLKLVGHVHLDEATGRLTSTFSGTPELPFTNFKLSFNGGAQAALATPTQCGEYEANADFTPWSSPFVADFSPASVFSLTEGPGGSGCSSNPLPFAPTLTAGSTTDQAGGFTNFSLLLQRGDGQQRIEKLQFRAPVGLSGMISTVPLCPEPQASQGTCPAASQIGHAVVASGPGPYPLVLPQPGAPELPIYLTGPYKGAPFGLSIVTPVIAGPFNLGTIITRASIAVDPTTAQITVATDPLPQVVKGVPTNLRQIDSVIDRPGFMFNPTNCNSQSFSGTAWGTPPPGAGGPGATAAISSHFQVGSCRSLEFAPKFTVTTSGQTSKANGASLTAKVTYPSVPQGTEADIGYVKVELPKALPSRLTTLQKACTNAQFEANPAGCPSASFIGHAVVHTPLLPVPLEGPAIFVSHGGEAFPSLTIVLQGDGVTVDLVGSTFISKAGVTSTTFKTVPDAPFSTFELTLPQGPYSALTANENLCSLTKTVTSRKKVTVRVKGRRIKRTVVTRRTVSASLTMPYEFAGQNGAVIKQTAAIGVSGCAKAKAVKKKKAKSHRIKQRRKR
jgi:hypothetical protein